MLSLQVITRSNAINALLRGYSQSAKKAGTVVAAKTLTDTAKKQISESTAKNDDDGESVTVAFKKIIATAANGDPVAVANASTKRGKNDSRNIVQTAFSALHAQGEIDAIDDHINKADTLHALLDIALRPGLQSSNALRIVSILSEWERELKINLSQFQYDPRYMKICRLLNPSKEYKIGSKKDGDTAKSYSTNDLSLVMDVASENEAAKLIACIQLPQMVQVLETLAQRKKRSTPLLRSLAHNISSSSETLNLKQCSDVLYSLATLNFSDTVLVTRISVDIQNELPHNTRPATVGSIITSLGLLKYRDTELLDALTGWTIQHIELCRPEDILSLFRTLSIINYPTIHAEELKAKVVNSLNVKSFSNKNDWLNFIWSLALLDIATAEQVNSVLEPLFIKQLVEEEKREISQTQKLKLLNINAVARHLIPNYKGAVISPKSTIFEAPIAHSKTKLLLTDALNDALKSLYSSDQLLRKGAKSDMGFLIDVECVFDKKLKPLPVEGEHKDAIKCALIVLDFHDMCKGSFNQPNGIVALTIKLLQKTGYKTLLFPHFEFNNTDPRLKRVKYLENKLKSVK